MVRIRIAREPDADALAAIYAPFVERTAISFETVPPGRDEMLRQIVETTAVYPWLDRILAVGVSPCPSLEEHRQCYVQPRPRAEAASQESPSIASHLPPWQQNQTHGHDSAEPKTTL